MAINCFRYFGHNSMDQVLSLDMHEYRLLCEAQRLKNIDREYWIHTQAFANNRATLRDKKGRLIYHNFTKFFDYEKALGKVPAKKKESPQIQAMKRFLKKKNQGG